jgi:hypothetical protein
MQHYFHACKTTRHCVAGLLFAVPIVAGAIYGWIIFEGEPLGRGMIALVGVPSAAGLAMWLWHLFHPKVAFIEISDTHLVWNDLYGFGMREWSFPFSSIASIREGGTEVTSEYLVFQSGISMELPTKLIPDQMAFFQALQKAAPHIRIDIKNWLQAKT